MAEQRKNRVSESRQNREEKCNVINGVCGRGSWIRTNDLQYPKLPRYQAALYPDDPRKRRGYTLKVAPARRSGRLSGR
jgi:hypothetical protein